MFLILNSVWTWFIILCYTHSMKNRVGPYRVILILASVFCFETGFAKKIKSSDAAKINFKKYNFGFTFKGKNPTWSQDLCKSLDYGSLKPVSCKKAADNIGNKSIRCSLPEKKSQLAGYLTIDACKADLQMSTEGDSP